MRISKNLLLLFYVVFIFSNKIDFVSIDFFDSLERAGRFKRETASEFFHLAKQLFDDYGNQFEYYQKPLIPKIIHQIWIGPKPFPEECKKYQKTWQKLHPDWEYKLWRDNDIRVMGLMNQEAYENAKNWGQKADIARYEILYRYGGVYVDVDFECLQPFDIFHHTCKFYAGLSNANYFFVYNGLIGSKKGHPILKFCMQYIKNATGFLSPEAIMRTTGPIYFTEIIVKCRFIKNLNAVIFPPTFFYPYPCWKKGIPREEITQHFQPETFAVHHWHSSWSH